MWENMKIVSRVLDQGFCSSLDGRHDYQAHRVVNMLLVTYRQHPNLSAYEISFIINLWHPEVD
jgi:hypothetical protein